MCLLNFKNLRRFSLVIKIKQLPYLLIISTIILYMGYFSANAQSSGSTSGAIVGKVKDSQGAVLVGATLSIKQIGTNLVRTVQSDSDGAYRISQLPPGDYEVTAQAEKFASIVEKTTVNIGVTRLIQFVLPVSQTNEIIEVSTGTLLNEEKTESSNNINQENIDVLPINRRNFLDFTLTTPRAVRDRVPTQGVAATSGLSFNGQAARFNNITIDGLDNNEYATGAVRATFSQDAVQEFQVVSDGFSAEFGRALGGVINIVTKGGSNNFHGSLFLLNRNDETSARDVFSPIKPNYKQYQFGGTFSGPIKKDKVFFFTSFERLSIKQNNFITISDASVSSARREGFALSNGPVPFALDTTSVLGRLDARLSPNNTFFVRYNFGGMYNGAFEPFGSLIGESNGGIQLLEDDDIAVSNTYINNKLGIINESRFLFGRRDQNILALGEGPQVRLVAPEGLITFGRGTLLPQPRGELIYQFVDNVSLAPGKQQVKFGVDFSSIAPDPNSKVPLFGNGFALFLPLDFSALIGIPGLPSFTGLQAFDPKLRTPQQLAFLDVASAQAPILFPGFPKNLPLRNLSLPFAYAQGFGNQKIAPSQKQTSLYFQDDIKLRPNLLFKAGLRYDINRARFVPSNNGNISPRLALAYRPNHLTNLKLHASYGLFFGASLFGLSSIVELTSIKQSTKIPIVPFPFSVVPFSLPQHHFPEGEKIPASINFTPQLSTVFTYDPALRNSYTQQISTGIDYLLKKNTLFSISYDYVRGIKLLSERNINPIVNPIKGDLLKSQLTGRVNPTKGDILEFESAFDSYYHAFTLSINHQIKNKLSLFAYYTFSKAIDNFIDVRFDLLETNDPLNLKNEKGLSLQDVRNRFVLSGLWQLDYKQVYLLKNFQVSTIINLESGKPYNLLAGQDLNLNGDNPPGDRPLGIGRNTGITPGFANVDLRLTRVFTFREHFHIQAIAEVFNLFNKVNISEVDRVFPPDEHGNFHLPKQENGRFIAPPDRYRNAFAPRQFQFGFRLAF